VDETLHTNIGENLDVNSGESLTVYLNNKTQPHPEFKPIEPVTLSEVEPGSIELLHCNCLEYFPYEQAKQLLELIVSRIKIGGFVIIEGTETYEIARNIVNGTFGFDEINQRLYNSVACSLSLLQIEQQLKEKGFETREKDIDNCKFYLKSERI